jgi:hypothetical protein
MSRVGVGGGMAISRRSRDWPNGVIDRRSARRVLYF